MPDGLVHRVSVGRPRAIAWQGRSVESGIFKAPVEGRVRVRRLNLDGDGQADLVAHGGVDKAVYAYPVEHYPTWEAELERELAPGSFGENLTISGLLEQETAIGDVVELPDCVLEVTEPRVSCYKIGVRLGRPDVAARLLSTRRTGCYLKVREEGTVAAGDRVVAIRRHPAGLTIAELMRLRLDSTPDDLPLVRAALELEVLSSEWRGHMERAEQRLTAPPRPVVVAPPPRALRIVAREQIADDVVALDLAAGDGDATPLEPFEPGQFVTLRVPLPDGGHLHRSYSLCGAPGAGAYRVMVKREPDGAGSGALHAHAVAGVELTCTPPAGAFTLPAGDGPVVLVAGGIGITPFRGMLAALDTPDAAAVRPVRLLYSVATRADEIDGTWLRDLAARRDWFTYVPWHSRSAGRLTAADVLDGAPPDAEVLICGPGGMVRELPDQLRQAGVPAQRIHVEAFAATARAGALDGADDVPPEGRVVTFSRSTRFTLWTQPGTTLLELAEAHQVEIPASCRAGSCGTCVTRVIDGEVRHTVDPSAPIGADECLPCIAVPATPLTLDA